MSLLASCATTDNSPNQSQLSIAYPSESSAVLYVDQQLSFSMEMPVSWLGQVEIEGPYDLPLYDGASYISVYHKPTHDDNPDIGLLFDIGCYPGVWTEKEPPIMAGSCTLVLQTDTNAYFFQTPSGVQWNEENNILGDSYKALEEQFDFVKEHISAI